MPDTGLYMSAHPLLPAALNAVATASALTRTVQSARDEVAGHTKDDRSPVTVADYAAQAVIAMILRSPCDEHLIVGEEQADELRQDDHIAIRSAVVTIVQRWRPQASEEDVLEAIGTCDHDGTASGYWALDPIDGTKGFLRGQQYAIALGYISSGNVTLGVLGCPNLPIDTAMNPAEPDPLACGSVRDDGLPSELADSMDECFRRDSFCLELLRCDDVRIGLPEKVYKGSGTVGVSRSHLERVRRLGHCRFKFKGLLNVRLRTGCGAAALCTAGLCAVGLLLLLLRLRKSVDAKLLELT